MFPRQESCFMGDWNPPASLRAGIETKVLSTSDVDTRDLSTTTLKILIVDQNYHQSRLEAIMLSYIPTITICVGGPAPMWHTPW